MNTFDDLGMPFPLYQGPVAHASVDSAGCCIVCDAESPIRFYEACYNCFRSGKADHVIDTEFGIVRVEDAAIGMTHGVPRNDPAEVEGYELIPHPIDANFPNDKWYHVRIASDYLFELLRTPAYNTWQGESWRFCCQKPCVFVGSVPAGLLPDTDLPTVDSISMWLRSPDWESTLSNDFGPLTYHVFRCSICGTIRYHEDVD